MTRSDVFFYLLLGHLFYVGVCSSCGSANPGQCNISTDCCKNHINNSSKCSEIFAVRINSTGSKVKEGGDITLTCVHDLPPLNLTFSWFRDGQNMSVENETLLLRNVLSNKKGLYVCYVNSTCGCCSSSPEEVTVDTEGVIILIVCGVSALALVVVMGLAMKVKLNRDNVKHKERMRQRAQAQQSEGPPPVTPR